MPPLFCRTRPLPVRPETEPPTVKDVGPPELDELLAPLELEVLELVPELLEVLEPPTPLELDVLELAPELLVLLEVLELLAPLELEVLELVEPELEAVAPELVLLPSGFGVAA